MCLAVMKDITNAKHLHRQGPITHGILIGIHIGIIGFLAAAPFFSAEYEKMFWVLCFLAMATPRIEPVESPAENSDDFSDGQLDPVVDEVVCKGT